MRFIMDGYKSLTKSVKEFLQKRKSHEYHQECQHDDHEHNRNH